MDLRTQFYLDCIKVQTGLSHRMFPHSNLKNFAKVTQSKAYKNTLENGKVFIGEGELPNTWVACYHEMIDEEDLEEVELVFEVEPTEEAIHLIQFVLSVEDYLSDPRIKPYVSFHGERTHWTTLPDETPQEKWEHYILLRDEEESKKDKKQNKRK